MKHPLLATAAVLLALAVVGAPLVWALVARHRAPVRDVRCPPPDQDWCCALWWPLSHDRGDHGGPYVFYDSHHGCGHLPANTDGDIQ